MVCSVHNHELDCKLAYHLIVGPLDAEEKKTFVVEMTMNMVLPKNILLTLKTKMIDSIINIRKVYNVPHRNKKAITDPKS